MLLGARFLASVVLPRPASRALHSAALRSASAAPMALRATLDPGRSSTGEKRAGGPGRRGPGWVAQQCGCSAARRWRARQRSRARRAGSAARRWRVGPHLALAQAVLPWHSPYARPDPHQQPAPAAAAKPPPAPAPPASSRTAGAGSRPSGEAPSDAAKASYDGTVPVTMPRFGVPEEDSSRRDASIVARCSSWEGYSAARDGYAVEEFRQLARRPVQDRHRERAGQGLAVGAQFCSEAEDLRLQFRGVLRAQGPDPLGVVEFVQGDREGVEGVRQGVPLVVGHAQHAAYAVAAEEEGVGGVGGLRDVRQEEARALRERLVRRFQFVVGLQGLRDDHPGGRVPGRRRADAVDDRSGLGLVAVLPEVRGLQRPYQVGVLQRGRRRTAGGRRASVAAGRSPDSSRWAAARSSRASASSGYRPAVRSRRAASAVWSTFSAGVSGRMGDTVLPGGDERERCAGQTAGLRGRPMLVIRALQIAPNRRRAVRRPPAYSVTPSIWSVWTDFAANGTLTDFPFRRMSERAV